MKLRIAETHYQKLRELLALSFRDGKRSRPETGCILLVARNEHPASPSLLVADVLEPQPLSRFRVGIFAGLCSPCGGAVWQAF
jgi:hypothetical protein